ncbi:MAG: SDR family oxidoreductase [Gemmatimonadales bacterium]|jgi:all-trans-retinol dehydrogenase (NAD+)
MTDLRGKTALITGAAGGIGRLLAHGLAKEGASLVLWDVAHPELKAVTEELRLGGANVFPYYPDLSDREAVYATARRVLEDCGPVDVLINNAGIVTGKPILEASDEEIVRTFAVNALAPFWTIRAFLPAMVERNGGHIVTIASAGGLVGAPRLTDYSASKFAAVGLDEALRLELRRDGPDIMTTVVCPFYVSTGMFDGVRTRFSWLLPILSPEYAVAKIVSAIKRNRRRLVMPRFIYIAPAMRLLPTAWFDALVDFFGVSRGMDEFRGRRTRSVQTTSKR